MAKLKFKDENNEFIPVVQDVKVNNVSAFDGKDADIKLKTINNQSIVGTGNINIQGGEGEYVKYSPNQNLTTQQKLNARNNISALGTNQVKQQSGDSTTDVISQKGVTNLLSEKQEKKPDGRTNLIASDTGKLNVKYLPATVLGGITYGGTFNDRGYITASSYAPELDGRDIRNVPYGTYPSFYFIYSGPETVNFFGNDYSVGDMALSTLNGWAHLNSTDAVSSVNGKIGQVILNADDIGAIYKYWGIDNRNKNLVTDAFGEVTVSDYSLGQIIVDYYQELPNVNPDLPHQSIPERARATVLHPSDEILHYNNLQLQNSYDSGEELEHEVKIYWAPEHPYAYPQYAYFDDGNNSFGVYYDDQISPAACYWIEYYDEQTGDPVWFTFSWSAQRFLPDESGNTNLLFETWTKVTYDSNTDTYSSEQAQWDDLPMFNAPVYVTDLLLEDDVFSKSFIWIEPKLAGEYTYFKVEPETTPATYYWGYTPSNVQADNNEDNPSSLAYIKNRATLNTNNTTLLPFGVETIKGEIQLHKVSKTGNYTDLKNKVGQLDTNYGEIFNTYSGNNKNIASAGGTHAEGINTQATSSCAHSEGSGTQALTSYSHAEGRLTTVSTGLTTYGVAGHAEGYSTTVTGDYGHSEGYLTRTTGQSAHSEGQSSIASGESSHAEGYSTTASGQYSHSEGYGTSSKNIATHAEGYNTTAQSDYAHAEGYGTSANGTYAHAEGCGTVASGQYTHSEGYETTALSYGAHAEGLSSSAVGNYSHAEGQETQSRGVASHAGGRGCIANKDYSFATGFRTNANSESQCVVGQYNVVDNANENMFIVGAGYVDSQTQNIVYRNGLVVRKDANIWTPGEIKVGGTDYSTGSSFVEKQSNKVTSISASSTDTEYPTAKCVYDIVGDIESLLQGV